MRLYWGFDLRPWLSCDRNILYPREFPFLISRLKSIFPVFSYSYSINMSVLIHYGMNEFCETRGGMRELSIRRLLLYLYNDFLSMRPVLKTICKLFLLGLVAGLIVEPSYKGLLDKILNDINRTSPTVWNIFTNNLRVDILIIVSGVFFAIIPMYILVTTGFMIGAFITRVTLKIGLMKAAAVVSLGIIPHAFTELFGLFITCALGIRLFYNLVAAIKGEADGETTKTELITVSAYFPFLLVLLYVSAYLEVNLSGMLLQKYMPK